MSSYTRLIVLGAVYQFQPVHGYFLRRELSTWHVDEWGNTQPGSVYNALKSLERDGYIEDAGTVTDGNYPARTVYRVTATGKVELLRIVREALWNVEAFDTKAAMAVTSFMFVLTREEVIEGMENRISKIDAIITANGYEIEDTLQSETTPRYVREIFDLSSARLRAEQEWARTLVTRLREGAYRFADETSDGSPTS